MTESTMLPAQIESDRLVLKPPSAADAVAVNSATVASFAQLQPFMDWAQEPPTMAQSLAFCESGSRELVTGQMCPLLMWRRSDMQLLGGVGFAGCDLAVPKFELGYWCLSTETGNGYVTEAVAAQCCYLFEQCGARRIELRMDERNEASIRVAQRLGFALEGTLQNDGLANDGSLRNTCVYALCNLEQLTALR